MDVHMSRQTADTFHHPRHPHTGQLWFAFLATLIYATAVPGMLSIHNPLGACGWGVACVICLCWFLLLRKENQWRKMEQLEVQNPSDDPFSPTPSIPRTHRSHSYPLSQHPLSQSMLGYRSAFPYYLTKLAIGCIIAVGVMLISFAIYLYIKAGVEHQPLNGSSQWMGAIAFTGATKSAAQLGWRMRKMRNTFLSVRTYLEEAYAPLP